MSVCERLGYLHVRIRNPIVRSGIKTVHRCCGCCCRVKAIIAAEWWWLLRRRLVVLATEIHTQTHSRNTLRHSRCLEISAKRKARNENEIIATLLNFAEANTFIHTCTGIGGRFDIGLWADRLVDAVIECVECDGIS